MTGANLQEIIDQINEENRQNYPNGQCQHRDFETGRCSNHCFNHPDKGWLCVCEEHFEMIEAKLIRVPPLRRSIDYVSTGRRTLLVDSEMNEVKSSNLNGDFSSKCKSLVEAYYKNYQMYTDHIDKPSSSITAAPVAPAQEEYGKSQEKKA